MPKFILHPINFLGRNLFLSKGRRQKIKVLKVTCDLPPRRHMSQKESRSKPKDSQSRGGLLIYSIPTLTRKDRTSNLKGWDPKSEWMELGTWNLKGCNLKLGMMESKTQKDVTWNLKGWKMKLETRWWSQTKSPCSIKTITNL